MRRVCLYALLFFAAVPAWAELGGDAASIERDGVRMQAARRLLPAQKYAVHEMQLAGGTAVREYLSADGKVFAVTWRGARMPDLRQLFGAAYFDRYRQAAAQRRGRGPGRIEADGLVVHSGGHMRAYAGMAYVPQLVPGDVSVDELE